jgi:Ni/Fe-hydrogenase subunit HybB-like protein
MATHTPAVTLTTPKELERPPLVLNNRKLSWITDKVASICEEATPAWWWIAFLPSALIAAIGLLCIGYQISNGVGVWGENHPNGWAWDITNFVFWIGIGHAGTLISAILFLTRQKWRTSINRAAEAMTLFAVMCAGIFPGIHVGRVWMAWFLAPVPNSNGIWPNFRSPLLWDVFAVSTYFTVSVLFWYTGLVPDLATLRDRATSRVKKFIYGIFALGWRGSNRNWRHYEMAYLLLAGLSTPLVLSVHSVVSFDFATSILPGWHTTIFPPYFVAGAIFGGFAMVLTIMLPASLLYPQLKELITRGHVDRMAKIILLTGSIVGYAYLMELFMAYFSANKYEKFTFFSARMGIDNPGWYAWAYYVMMFCNVISPQIFWFKWARNNLVVVFIVCQFVNIGMWFERFVIIVTSLAQDFLPSSWGKYEASWVEIWTFIGTFGIFLSLFLLFMRFLPMIAMSEVKLVTPEADPHADIPDSGVGIEAHKPQTSH